jgi:hypothetical protein
MTKDQLCSYEYAEDLHILTFHDNTPQAIRAFFAHMDTIYQGATADMTFHFLVDIYTAGKPLPLWRTFATGQNWAKRLDVHPTAMMAFVYYPTPIISLTDTLFKTTGWGHLEVALFDGSQPEAYDQAKAWLR